MPKRTAVISIEFDDSDGLFEEASDLALYVEVALNKLRDLDVTVYSTPVALMQDTNEGIGMYAEDRENAGTPVLSPAEVSLKETANIPKMG